MKKKHHFGKMIVFLISIIVICIVIIFFKQQNMDMLSVFHEQEVIGEENEIENEIQVNKERIEYHPKENEENIIETQVVAPILGTLGQEEDTTNREENIQGGYFYSQLDSNAKKIYEAIETHIEDMKNGNYTIDLGSTFQTVLEVTDGEQKLKQAYQDAWDAITTDRVDLFYLDTSKIYLFINTTKIWNIVSYTVTIGPEKNENYYASGYTSKADVETTIAQLEMIRKQVIDKASGSTYQKIMQVNDWLVEALSYDETISRTNTRNIYGALIEKEVVCEGYAKAFQYLMDGLQIPCILVSGTGTNSNGITESHLWNYVQIANNWYAVDVTCNDPIIQGGGRLTTQMKHKYLCKGKSFLENHTPSGKVSQAGMTFVYPELNVTDYK